MTETRVTDPVTGGSKGRKPEEYALIPVEALAEVARVYGLGAEKYTTRDDDGNIVKDGRNNWRLGYTWSLSYSALMRHCNAFWSGESLDEDGLHHLAHASFHLNSLMTFDWEELGTDDRAVKKVKKDAGTRVFGVVSPPAVGDRLLTRYYGIEYEVELVSRLDDGWQSRDVNSDFRLALTDGEVDARKRWRDE